MSDVFCREVDTKHDFVVEEAKKYGLEKMFQNQHTKIILKESEYKSVQRIINKFSEKSYAEIDTLFKLYKLQFYSLDLAYFKGTQYSPLTLNNLKSLIKSSTLDDSIESSNPMTNLINNLVREIKQYSKPFPGNLVNGKRHKIKDLLKASITEEDRQFIKSEIKPRYIRKRKERLMNQFILHEQKGQDMEQIADTDSINKFKYLLDNAYTSAAEIKNNLTSLTIKSISTYTGYIRQLDRRKKNGLSIDKPGNCPSTLYKLWLAKTGEKVSDKITIKSICKHSIEDDKIIVDNYTKGAKVVAALLPHRPYNVLANYVGSLKSLDAGKFKEKPVGLSLSIYNLWLDKKTQSDEKEMEVKEIVQNNSSSLENTDKVQVETKSIEDVKSEKEVSAEIKQSKYELTNLDINKCISQSHILMFEGKVVAEGTKDYISGYRDAMIQNMFKIYQKVD